MQYYGDEEEALETDESPKTYKKDGEGINTIAISSDPNELIERMDLLIASKQAGNTGVDDKL